MKVAATIMSTPGTVRSRRISGEARLCSAKRALDERDLLVEEGDLTQATVDGDLLVERQLLLGEPLAPALAEQVAGRRAFAQGAGDHRVDLVLGARALTQELRATGDPQTQRA